MRKPHVLFLITSDPRHSARPAEGVRVAAGLAVGQKAQVSLYWGEPLAGLPEAAACDLVDGDCFEQYLPVLAAHGGELLTAPAEDQAPPSDDNAPSWHFLPVTTTRLAELAAGSQIVLQF